MPVDINQLIEGWLELESDPGLFTLLLEDFGVKGVQIEEIYDLQKPIENPVYGFIFLFRWTEERRSRRKVVEKGNAFVKDEELVNNLFFAQQMVPNSCATHALLSVLLNCPKIHLGETLMRLKNHTHGMNPENKGWAIGNTPELAKAHNSHAVPQARRRLDKTGVISTGKFIADAYHFVSYVPINGRLFELDGLKPYPIDHGPWREREDWTEKFHAVITDRLRMAAEEGNHDICYNLMAVVPDKRLALSHKLSLLRTNRQIVLDALQQLVQNSCSSPEDTEQKPFSIKRSCSSSLKETELETEDVKYQKTEEKRLKISKEEPISDSRDAKRGSSEVPEVSITVTSVEDSGVGNKKDNTFAGAQSSVAQSSSADTVSEIGSTFNSAQESNLPSSKDLNKFVVIRVAMDDTAEGTRSENAVRRVCLEAGALPMVWEKPTSNKGSGLRVSPVGMEKKIENEGKKTEHSPSHHTFSPKDLLALVKNLEIEISLCEGLLRDENEKRKQYKIDDCRRTHNYDQFICTFLSMLAEQGKLAELVQQHLSSSMKKQMNVVNISPPARTTSVNKTRVGNNTGFRRRIRSKKI